MGGPGAGSIILIVGLLISPLGCLAAALITWFLVLPKWTGAALVMFLVSCALLAASFALEPKTPLWMIAVYVYFALWKGALLMIPAAFVYRIGSLIYGLVTRR